MKIFDKIADKINKTAKFATITKIQFLIVIFLLFLKPSFAQIPSNYLNLQIEAANLAAFLYWDPLSGNAVLQKNGHQISFGLESQIALIDFKQFQIIDAPIQNNNLVYVSKEFIEFAKNLFQTESDIPFFKVGAILIDPGHGGKDPGAIGTHNINGKQTTVQEKDITLSTSLELFSLLKTRYPDKQVLLTRSTDIYLTLEERVEKANAINLKENEAIIYISIHANAAFDTKAKGFEVWYLSPGYRRSVLSESDVDKDLFPILNSMLEEEYTTESILIAKFILDSLDAEVGNLSPKRGIKEEEWFVVRNAHMPSVLVELGFVTNKEEATLMADKNYLRKTAEAIYNGINTFIMHFEQSRGFTGGQ